MQSTHFEEEELARIKAQIRELTERAEKLERKKRNKGYLISFINWPNLNGYYMTGDPIHIASETCKKFGTEAIVYAVDTPQIVGTISASGEFKEFELS